jgi:alkylhydroperoxidase/carboxymuconolactone decarboxylase family protein YurZ
LEFARLSAGFFLTCRLWWIHDKPAASGLNHGNLLMSKELTYGKLDLGDAHSIAGGANSLLMALQEFAEAGMKSGDEAAKYASKGVDLGDGLLDTARLLVARGVFSNERHLSEILIYSAAIVDGCEVCALTHIDGAIRAKAPEAVIDTVQAIALYVRAQANDDTYLLFDAYTKHWQRFAEWPHLTGSRVSNLKFYNLIALLMSLVVRKRRLVRLHTYELLTRSDVTPEEILEIIGIAQVMGGFPARWEAVHIHNVTIELRKLGLLPEAFVAVLDSIPTPRTKA